MSRPLRPAVDRFWEQVEVSTSDACWTFRAYLDRDGYGLFNMRRGSGWVRYRAHRFSYELVHGPLAPRMVIDHLCRNRACVNPAHLDAVTQTENNRRSESLSARNARKTHCKYGHEFTPENTRWRKHYDGIGRACRTCDRIAMARTRTAAGVETVWAEGL